MSDLPGSDSPRNAPVPPMPTIRTVGVVAKRRLADASGLLEELAAWLAVRGVSVVFETETADLAPGARRHPTASRDELATLVDLVLVLGGDGTLLSMADRIAQAHTTVPILGVNFGGLGFLTEVTLPELYPSLEAALRGHARLERRLMLQCRVVRRGTVLTDMAVLNDVVVTRGVVSRIIDLAVSVNDGFVAHFKADGLIVATPTGSTAYNLAAGGPIVSPDVDAVVLTPIAPHTLTNRPVVIPASSHIRIQPLAHGAPQEIYVTFDGQTGSPLEMNDVITVERSDHPVYLVKATTRDYFGVLRQKLKWAER